MSSLNTALFIDAATGLPIPPRQYRPPPLYQAPSIGKIKALLVNDEEVDQLRITAIRRCTQVLADISKLMQRPCTFAERFMPDDDLLKLLLAMVDFDAVEQIEKAMDRLESLLGKDAAVSDPRVEFGGYCSIEAAREQVTALTAAAARYRRMREQLR